MNEDETQALFDSVAEVMLSAAEHAQGVLNTCQVVLDSVYESLAEWQAAHAAPVEPDETGGRENKFQYLLDTAKTVEERTHLNEYREFLTREDNAEILDRLYNAERVRQSHQGER